MSFSPFFPRLFQEQKCMCVRGDQWSLAAFGQGSCKASVKDGKQKCLYLVDTREKVLKPDLFAYLCGRGDITKGKKRLHQRAFISKNGVMICSSCMTSLKRKVAAAMQEEQCKAALAKADAKLDAKQKSSKLSNATATSRDRGLPLLFRNMSPLAQQLYMRRSTLPIRFVQHTHTHTLSPSLSLSRAHLYINTKLTCNYR